VRIVSLLPSATEILFAVGAGADVVGVTFECDFPPEARQRQIVSNTTLAAGLTPAQIDAAVRARTAAGEDLYTLDEGALRVLDPDLVVTQDLCAVCAVDISEVDKALEHLGCRADVVTLDPMTLDEVLASIETVGRATGSEERAEALVRVLRRRLDEVAKLVAARRRPRMAVLEWTDPPFSSGHWVPDMVRAAGATAVLGDSGERSRTRCHHRRPLRLSAGRGDQFGPGPRGLGPAPPRRPGMGRRCGRRLCATGTTCGRRRGGPGLDRPPRRSAPAAHAIGAGALTRPL
jgi:iron complex transport system substrate-binding protein